MKNGRHLGPDSEGLKLKIRVQGAASHLALKTPNAYTPLYTSVSQCPLTVTKSALETGNSKQTCFQDNFLVAEKQARLSRAFLFC